MDLIMTIYQIVQIALIAILVYRMIFGKDDGERLIKRAQKFMDIIGKVKRIGEITLIAEEILELAISKRLNEVQFGEILQYIKKYIGDA